MADDWNNQGRLVLKGSSGRITIKILITFFSAIPFWSSISALQDILTHKIRTGLATLTFSVSISVIIFLFLGIGLAFWTERRIKYLVESKADERAVSNFRINSAFSYYMLCFLMWGIFTFMVAYFGLG